MEVTMPDDVQRTPIQIAWINFVKSVQALLVPQADDRPLDQYLSFRDAVVAFVQNERFLTELNTAWTPQSNDTGLIGLEEIRNVLLLELQAFPLAVEVAKATEKPEEPKSRWRKMLGGASTVSGSVKDLPERLPWYARCGLTAFNELIDLFKGKD
jgi:hypothetical protein